MPLLRLICALSLWNPSPDRGNVCEFLNNLPIKKEELATYSFIIKEKDYCSTIIKSLPPHLSAFASNLLGGAQLYSSTKMVDPDKLILVSEEYEHHVAQIMPYWWDCFKGK